MTHLTLAQLSASLDEQIGGTTGDAVRLHLGICPDCRAWRDRLARDGERLRELLATEPDEDTFDELFDGIEAAIRSDAIADDGPRAVTMKRTLLGLVRGREPSPLPDATRPASSAMARPPIARPPVLPPADPELEERGQPDAAGFVKPPAVQFPAEVKPSSAEIVRPGPPRFATPAPEGPKSGALSEPFTPPPPARTLDIVPMAPRPDEPPAPRVEKAPQWHHEATPPEHRPFEPIVGPRRDTPKPAPRPAELAAARASEPASRASREMPAPLHETPARSSEDVIPRARVAHLEWMVVGGVLLAALSVTFGLWQWRHARNVERARRAIEQSAPSTAPTTPTPASGSPASPPPADGKLSARDRPAPRTALASAPISGSTERTEARAVPPSSPSVTTAAAAKPAAGTEPATARRAATPAPAVSRATSSPRESATPAREPMPTPAREPRPTPPANTPAPSSATNAEDNANWPLLCGQVLDEQGEPIAGARVLLADLDLGARTDRRGRFCISAPPGDRTLSVVALGFKTHRQVLALGSSSPELRVVLAGAQ